MSQPITTRIHVHNSITRATTNKVLVFLQPQTVSDNFLFSAWNVLNPSPGSNQHCDLTTSFAASIAEFASTHGDYTDPVGLVLGEALTIVNPNNQSATITSKVDHALTPAQVGLYNGAETPPTDVSVVWYVNGNKVVETNNTAESTLNPGFTSLFELKQSVYLMFGQQPGVTTTYTPQTVSAATAFAIPNGATDVYIEAYTDPNGVDSFRLASPTQFAALQAEAERTYRQYRHTAFLEQENAALRGQVGSPLVTRYFSDASAVSTHGDSLLGGHGIGAVDFNPQGALTQMRLGIFAQGAPLPTVGTDYVVTGTDDITHLPVRYTVRCTVAARPSSTFGPVPTS